MTVRRAIETSATQSSPAIALATCAILLLSLAAAQLRVVPPVAAFGIFSLALLFGGALSLLVGVLGLVRGAPVLWGRRGALFAVIVGVCCLLVIGSQVLRGGGATPIHDITTDISDAPDFVEARLLPENRGRDLDYPNGAIDTPVQQQRAYADVLPIHLEVPPAEAHTAALAVAEESGWDVYHDDRVLGFFEARVETSVFRFVDDVVVRIRPTATGSVVDLRSTSRVGVSDMGVNAARIVGFRAALAAHTAR